MFIDSITVASCLSPISVIIPSVFLVFPPVPGAVSPVFPHRWPFVFLPGPVLFWATLPPIFFRLPPARISRSSCFVASAVGDLPPDARVRLCMAVVFDGSPPLDLFLLGQLDGRWGQ